MTQQGSPTQATNSNHEPKKNKGKFGLIATIVVLFLLIGAVGSYFLYPTISRLITSDSGIMGGSYSPTPTPFIDDRPSNVSVGKTIKFGNYEQDNNTANGKEEIEWDVLAVDGKKALIISKYAMDVQPYNSEFTDVTWETCTLRTFLNNTFLNDAFGAKHQALILSSNVSADENPEYDVNPGNATTDKVFLLSINEANQYYSSDESRKCVPTAYAIANGAGAYTSSDNTKDGKATCAWLLRSPGFCQLAASCVISNGAVASMGDSVSRHDYSGVRPALWITLES